MHYRHHFDLLPHSYKFDVQLQKEVTFTTKLKFYEKELEHYLPDTLSVS